MNLSESKHHAQTVLNSEGTRVAAHPGGPHRVTHPLDADLGAPTAIQLIVSAQHEQGVAATGAQNLQVQSLRGLACLFLVSFHVIGTYATSGIQVADDSFYRDFTNLFAHLRMPLFAFLSGFVYALRPVTPGNEWPFARKKLLRLWLPMVTVATIYFFASYTSAEAHWRMPVHDIWKIYFFPYLYFWFLQAMILIFAMVICLEKAQLLVDARRYGVTLAAAVGLSLACSSLSPKSFFSFAPAIHLLPFFLLGLGANRFRASIFQPAQLWICVLVFVLAMAIHTRMVLTPGVAIAGRGTFLSIAIGLSGTLVLFRWFPYSRMLAWVGAYSFCIYLYHPFFAGISRAVLHHMGVASNEIQFAAGLAAGMLGPVAIERVIRRVPVARPFLLGQSRT